MLITAIYFACRKGYRITMLELAEEKQKICDYFPKTKKCYGKQYIKTLIEYLLYSVSLAEWQKVKKQNETLEDLFLFLESNMDIVFVNLANRLDEEARQMLHNADLTVICLTQSRNSFDIYFARYANLSAKIFLLIGNYFEDVSCDRAYFCQKYDIKEEQLAVIANNPEFQMACIKGNVGRYMRKSGRRFQNAIKSQFFKEIERTVEKMYEYMF